MDDMINNMMDIPKWMTTGKTIFAKKIQAKEKQWIIIRQFLMTGIIANSVY